MDAYYTQVLERFEQKVIMHKAAISQQKDLLQIALDGEQYREVSQAAGNVASMLETLALYERDLENMRNEVKSDISLASASLMIGSMD